MFNDLFSMDYTAAEFDIQRINSYTLLVQAGHKEHVLAVVDDEGNLLLLTTFDLDDLHSQAADILAAPFARVRVACPQHAFTFVPDEVYDDSHLAEYASFIADGMEAERVAVSRIPSIAVRQVYAVEPLAYYRFSERFPHAHFIPNTAVLLQVAGGKLAKKQGTYLGVDVCESRLTLYAFRQGQFLFCNTFEIADDNDFNYHLLHAVRGLDLSWDSVQCLLSGGIEPQDAYHRVIGKYTDQAEFADTARLSRVAIPGELDKHQHRYLALMGLHACEL